MKKVQIIFSSLLVAALMTSCSGDGNVTTPHDSEIENHDEHNGHDEHEGHDHDAEANELGLNDGKKWEVNAEMKVHVKAMEGRINAFTTSESKDYASLAIDLDGFIGELTSSCTMTGESHNELHNWLLPHIKTVEKLEKADTDENASLAFADIEASMTTFNTYFE